MSTALAEKPAVNGAVLEQVVAHGDLKGLSQKDRLAYYLNVCGSLGLNPATRPFEYITLNGKLTLYARKDCTDQLRAIKNVSVTIVARDRHEDVYVVTARATLPSGRMDESIGAVPLGTLKGEALANALMKAETKAKRRVTLSICGLGLLDESEVDSIPTARTAEVLASPEQRERIDALLQSLKIDAKKAEARLKQMGITDPAKMTCEQAARVLEALEAKAASAQPAPAVTDQRCSVQKEQLIRSLCDKKRQLPEDVAEHYHVKTLADLTEAQATEAIDWLEKVKDPEDERQPGDESE